MNVQKLIDKDVQETIANLKHTREWLKLNLESLDIQAFKKIRTEIERLEILVEIYQDEHS